MRSPVILRVFKNSQLVEVKQFDLDQIVIGHQAGADSSVQLDLASDDVSPIHCLIELRDSGYYICDLGSRTGTFKNGQAVLDEAIASGDEIQLGPYRIVFFVGVPKPKSAPAAVAKPVPPPAPATPEAPKAAPAPEAKSEAKPAAKEETVVAATPAAIPVARPAETPKPAESKSESKPEPAKASVSKIETKKPQSRSIADVVPEAKAAPGKPMIRSGGDARTARKKEAKTFAPPSEIRDLRDHLKPGKGNVVEVVVAWKERVIETHHFRRKGAYRVGPQDRDHIRLTSASVPRNWVLVDIGGAVKVNVADAMEFEMVSVSQGRRKMDECLASGKATRTGNGTAVRLDQNEMICLGLGEMNIFVRYAPQAPVVPMLPPLGLSGTELSGLITAVVLTALLAFYISATTPKDLNETQQEELTRTAQVIFNKPPDVPKPPEPPPPPPPPPKPETPPPPPPPPVKAKVADEKKEIQKKGAPADKPAAKAQTAGRAAEVAPIPNSQNRPKKFTSTRQGGAVKIGEQAGANANAPAKDMTKVGLFSAFGGGGVRNKLDQAYTGAGDILGQADKATGAAGFGENRAGDDLGNKFKDTGAGGKGTATQGIAGVGTKGRGSGQAAYGSLDGLGSKTSVAIEPGGADEDFIGTIDREAVRRRVKHYLHEIRGCYVRELNRIEKGQKLEGKVMVTWEIAAKGVARNVRIKSSTLGNSAVENCIKDRLASWSFPEPPVGMTAEVTYPFYLRQEN